MRRPERVVVISVDGLLPDYYLDPRWPAPAMQQLVREGAHAVRVRPVFPALTYPGHTTLVTGALPARHGICSNREHVPKSDPPWLKDARLIKVPALWDAVKKKGGTTAAILWPLTCGAAIDWLLPDIWPGGDGNLVEALRGNDRPHGLLEEVEREATGRLTPEMFNNKLLMHDLHVALISRYLFETYQPTLTLIHTQAVVQVPQEPDWRNPRRARAVAASDQVVSTMLEVIERTKAWDRTAVLVVGDHGNTEVHTAIRPNVWLREAGLRGEKLENAPWKATLFALGGSAFPKGDFDAMRDVIERVDPDKRATFRFVEREELDLLGADPEVPWALAAERGFVLDDRADGPDMQPNPGMSHGHHPDLDGMHTGFLAKGAGIRAGTKIPEMPLTSIAPTVAELLDLDFHAPDGIAYAGLFE